MSMPMMSQFHALKEQDPERLLLFRVDDDYVLLQDDAGVAGRVLGLGILPASNLPDHYVTWFPAADLEANLAKFVRAGHRAAVLEQVTDGKPPKGAKVERVVTPGRLVD